MGDRYFFKGSIAHRRNEPCSYYGMDVCHDCRRCRKYHCSAGDMVDFTKLSKPLKKLSDASLKIAEGDYTSRVEGIYTDEMGNLARTFNLMADNTQQAIDEMKSKQHQLEGVLQGMHDGVLAVNADNMILFLNDSAKQMLELPRYKQANRLKAVYWLVKLLHL